MTTCDVCRLEITEVRQQAPWAIKVRQTGDLVFKVQHDHCHTLYMAGKPGLVDIESQSEIDDAVARVKRAREMETKRVIDLAPVGSQGKFDESYTLTSDKTGFDIRRGGGRFRGPRAEKDRVIRIFNPRKRNVGLGNLALARVLGAGGR